MESIGIRELRNQVAAVVRRAGSGERVVITVDGNPVAQIGPIEPSGAPTLLDLAAAGLIHLPARGDHPAPPPPVAVPIDTRPDQMIAELRGGPAGRVRR